MYPIFFLTWFNKILIVTSPGKIISFKVDSTFFLACCPSLKLSENAQNAKFSLKFGKMNLAVVYMGALAHCVQKFRCIAHCMKIFRSCPQLGFSPLHDCIFWSIHHLRTQITIPSSLQRVESPQKISIIEDQYSFHTKLTELGKSALVL